MAISTSNALTVVAERGRTRPFRIEVPQEESDARRRARAQGRRPWPSGDGRASGDIRATVARWGLDPDGPGSGRAWMAAAFLLGAIARDVLGDPGAGVTLLGPGAEMPAAPPRTRTRHIQALTYGETRVLQYLPTNLSAREIADEMYISVNTVKTHQRHLYQKLGAHSRTEAVLQARALGMLASAWRGR